MSNPTLAELSDYQKQVIAAIGYKQATDYDTGSTYWTDNHNGDQDAGLSTRLQTPGGTTPDELLANYLAGFDPRHGTAGYVDAGPKLPNGYTSVDPSIQNAFKEFASLNGKNYIRSDSSYGGLTYDEVRGSHSSIPGLMDKYGITPDMFVEDPTFGKMIEDNRNTSAFIRAAHGATQPQTFMDSFLTSMPLMMGSFGMGALAAPAVAAGLGVPTSVAKAGLGMIPSALQGKAPGIGSLLGMIGGMGGSAISGIGDSVGNTASGFGDWLKSLFSGGSTGATSGMGAGGSIGGGMDDMDFNFDDPNNIWNSVYSQYSGGGTNSFPLGNFIGDGPGEGGGSNFTPEQQWAQNMGALNPDGTINWQLVDQHISGGDPNIPGQGMGEIDSGAPLTKDAMFPLGNSPNGMDNILKTLFGGGAGLLKSLFGGGGSGGGGNGGGNGGGILGSLFGGGSGGGGLFGNLGGGLIDYFTKDHLADKLMQGYQEAAKLADPFREQRPQYQQKLAQSYNDPNFFQNDPVFKGLQDQSLRQAQASAASQGFNQSGNMLHDVARSSAETGYKYALPYQQQLAQNAGANFGPGFAGTIAGQGVQASTGMMNDAFGGLGYAAQPLLSSLFGNSTQQMNQQALNKFFNSFGQQNSGSTGGTGSQQSGGQTPNVVNGGNGGGPSLLEWLV